MIEIKCPEEMAEHSAFAERMGLKEQLDGKLKYLANYYNDRDDEGNTVGEDITRCDLYRDFAPHSFRFVMFKLTEGEWVGRFPGGLIYQGPDCPADGSFPSLTVSLNDGTGWFVHT